MKTQETRTTAPIEAIIIPSGVDLVRLELHKAGETLAWVDLTRERAREWGGALGESADRYATPGSSLPPPAPQYMQYRQDGGRIRRTRGITATVIGLLLLLSVAELIDLLPAALSMRWQFWAAAAMIAQDMLGHLSSAVRPGSTFLTPFFSSTRGYQSFWAAHWAIVLALMSWACFGMRS